MLKEPTAPSSTSQLVTRNKPDCFQSSFSRSVMKPALWQLIYLCLYRHCTFPTKASSSRHTQCKRCLQLRDLIGPRQWKAGRTWRNRAVVRNTWKMQHCGCMSPPSDLLIAMANTQRGPLYTPMVKLRAAANLASWRLAAVSRDQRISIRLAPAPFQPWASKTETILFMLFRSLGWVQYGFAYLSHRTMPIGKWSYWWQEHLVSHKKLSETALGALSIPTLFSIRLASGSVHYTFRKPMCTKIAMFSRHSRSSSRDSSTLSPCASIWSRSNEVDKLKVEPPWTPPVQ